MHLSFVHNESRDICYDSRVCFDFMMPLNANYVIHKARASNHKKTNGNTHEAAFYTLGIAPGVCGLNVSECLTLQSQLNHYSLSGVSRLSRPLLSAQCLNSGFFSSDGNDDDPAEVKFSIALKSARQKRKERQRRRERGGAC